MRTATIFLAALICAVPSAHAQRAKTPADATVYIRAAATFHVEIVETNGLSQRFDIADVPVVTGTGFVISSSGHVLTNEHVINPDLRALLKVEPPAKVTGAISRIEACFPREAHIWHDLIARTISAEDKCLDASIVLADGAVDLAVLLIGAPMLPYIAFADSDAVAVGDTVDAVGFPLGGRLEIAKSTRDVVDRHLVPSLSTTRGSISALRMGCGTPFSAVALPCATAADRDRELRFLQISNSVNSGSSGGPLVDRRGFAVGVVQSKIAEAGVEGIAFAIPINVIKGFLEARGLDTVLATQRLRQGPLTRLDAKKVSVRFPEGIADVSPNLTRVENDPRLAGVTLRVDRVASPWTPQQLEQSVVGTATFERLRVSSRAPFAARLSGKTAAAGRVFGTSEGGGDELEMSYAIVDLGDEKLIARYIGTAERLAFNQRVLEESLLSVAGERFLLPAAARVDQLSWTPSTDSEGRKLLPIPVGWTVEANGPAACTSMPQPVTVGSASPTHDFTVSLRAAVWSGLEMPPEKAAAACFPNKGDLPGTSYAVDASFLGVRYVVEGMFLRLDDGRTVQMEVVAPAERKTFAVAFLSAWMKKVKP